MNILQISSYNAYPPAAGGQVRTHGLAKALASNGHDIKRYVLRGVTSRIYKEYEQNGLSRDILDVYQSVVYAETYPEYRPFNPLYDVGNAPMMFSLPPIFLAPISAFMRSPKVDKLLSWADIIVLEKPWSVNILSEAHEDTPVVYSSHDFIPELYDEPTNFLERWFYQKAHQMERLAVEVADLIVCISKRDCQNLQERYRPDCPLLTVPNSIPASEISNQTHPEPARCSVRERHGINPKTIVGVFVGGTHAPNVDAAKFIINLAKCIDKAEFIIVGEAGNTLESYPENVTTTGFVDEIEPYLAAADFALNPITQGSGSNVKMLDYLSSGLPVITTDFGTRGYDVANVDGVMVVNRNGFKDCIEKIRRSDKFEEMGKANYQYAKNNLTWESQSEKLMQAIKKLR